MKQARLILVIVAAFSVYSTCFAETMRPLMSRENRLPEMHQLEVGSLFSYQQFEEADPLGRDLKRHEGTIDLYARFGLLDNLSIYASVPYGFINSDQRDDKYNGIRDVRAGLELLAYEGIYEYPFVIPYAEVSFPTGNDDKFLGAGDVGAMFGTAVGTTVYDIYHYILDGRYQYTQTGNKSEGFFALAAAFIWDLSDRFSVLAEAKITEKPSDSDKDIPAYFSGGMCYEATRNLSIYWYGGVAVNADENGGGHIKIAYRF